VRLRELAELRRRFGYRRLLVLLRREGWELNHKRGYRLYVEEKLSLRRKRIRSSVRHRLAEPTGLNQVWSVAFMTDAFSSGRRFRNSLAAWPSTSEGKNCYRASFEFTNRGTRARAGRCD
jgi:transposase InsO family protein